MFGVSKPHIVTPYEYQQDKYVDTTVIGLKEKALTGGGLGDYELCAKKSAEVIVVTRQRADKCMKARKSEVSHT